MARQLCILIIQAAFLLANAAVAAERSEGTVVSAGNGKITIALGDREESYDVDRDAMVLLNNQQSTLEKLTRGDAVKLQIEKKNSKQMVTLVDAKSNKSKSAHFSPRVTP